MGWTCAVICARLRPLGPRFRLPGSAPPPDPGPLRPHLDELVRSGLMVEPGPELGRGLLPRTPVGPMVVVVVPPGIQRLLRVDETQEPMLRETLLPEPAIEDCGRANRGSRFLQDLGPLPFMRCPPLHSFDVRCSVTVSAAARSADVVVRPTESVWPPMPVSCRRRRGREVAELTTAGQPADTVADVIRRNNLRKREENSRFPAPLTRDEVPEMRKGLAGRSSCNQPR